VTVAVDVDVTDVVVVVVGVVDVVVEVVGVVVVVDVVVVLAEVVLVVFVVDEVVVVDVVVVVVVVVVGVVVVVVVLLEPEYVEPLKVSVYELMEVASCTPGLLNSPTANPSSIVDPTPSVGKSYGEAFFRAKGR
jgi:hypothetical protein